MTSTGSRRTQTALVLSALTLVGGHFYNRRWDHAVLWFVVLQFWNFGAYTFAMVRLSAVSESGVEQDLSSLSLLYWKIFLLGVALLWIAGLVVTFLDAKRADASPM
jgi:uncharacterized membrane protein